MSNLLRAFDAQKNPNVPDLRTGDNVSVFVRLKEGNNTRTQEYKGTVIRVRGSENDATFTVRRVASNGIGVERTFLMRSPNVEKVMVHRHSYVRRSRLYYLRERSGKSARLRQKFSK